MKQYDNIEMNTIMSSRNSLGQPSDRILITSGPTREYLDPVRFLTNGSSGKMGAALARAALDAGFAVTIVSGPVAIEYPGKAEVVFVTSTDEMLEQCVRIFPQCVGVIGAAAPCDYRPKTTAFHKLSKQDYSSMTVELVETPDVMATLGKMKLSHQWAVPFALETKENAASRAIEKLQRKNGDLIVLNGPDAMFGDSTHVEIFDRSGKKLKTVCNTKDIAASEILKTIYCNRHHNAPS